MHFSSQSRIPLSISLIRLIYSHISLQLGFFITDSRIMGVQRMKKALIILIGALGKGRSDDDRKDVEHCNMPAFIPGSNI